MPVKKYKPTTPSNRFTVVNTYKEITTSNPEKSLIVSQKSSGGRNKSGKMTVRHRGGGHKRRLRIIDFKRDKYNIPGKISTIEYDPNRSAFIALVVYADGEKRYILAPDGIKVGDTILSGEGIAPDLGNTLPLANIPLGTFVHNIELNPKGGGTFVRSAGSRAQLMAREGKYATIKMPSGEIRMVLKECLATVGNVSNTDHSLQRLGKAGRKRWLGRRPHVRGVVMNPVDHPMGGGEGRASGGHPRSRNGIKAKGQKTRTPKNPSNKFIINRRNSSK